MISMISPNPTPFLPQAAFGPLSPSFHSALTFIPLSDLALSQYIFLSNVVVFFGLDNFFVDTHFFSSLIVYFIGARSQGFRRLGGA